MQSYIPFLPIAIFSVIILFMSSSKILTLSLGLLTVAVALFVASIQNYMSHALLLRTLSIISVSMFGYFLVEVFRFGHWERYHYHPSDDTATKPPPEWLLLSLPNT